MSESDSDSFHSVEEDGDESLAERDANATDKLQRPQLAPKELSAEQAVVTNVAAGNDGKSGIMPRYVYIYIYVITLYNVYDTHMLQLYRHPLYPLVLFTERQC